MATTTLSSLGAFPAANGGPATATELADALSTNTGATSYHLRKLESVGLVTDTGEGEGKRRVWRAATDFHSWTNSAFRDDQDAATALDWLQRNYVRQFAERAERWLDAAADWPSESVGVGAVRRRELGPSLPRSKRLGPMPCRHAQSSSQRFILRQALECGTPSGDVAQLDDQCFPFVLSQMRQVPGSPAHSRQPGCHGLAVDSSIGLFRRCKHECIGGLVHPRDRCPIQRPVDHHPVLEVRTSKACPYP
jgi:DNA-binding transcriptional ArsR family regulator